MPYASLHLTGEHEDRFYGAHAEIIVWLLAKLLRGKARQRGDLCAQLLEDGSTGEARKKNTAFIIAQQLNVPEAGRV